MQLASPMPHCLCSFITSHNCIMVDSYLAWSVLQKRQIAFTNYKDYIGMDITSLVTLPVWIMEPYTILQKVAEIMEYTDALDRAAATEDPYERSAIITGTS